MYLSLARSKTRTQRIARINHQSASSRIPDSHLTCPTKPRERRCCSTCSTNRWRHQSVSDVSRDFEMSERELDIAEPNCKKQICSVKPSVEIMASILFLPIVIVSHPNSNLSQSNPPKIHISQSNPFRIQIQLFAKTALRKSKASTIIHHLPCSLWSVLCSLWCHPFCLSRPHSLSRALAAVKAIQSCVFCSPELCRCSSFS